MIPYIYHGNVIRVIDGDTIEVLVELGFNISTKIKFRLNGIDAPEKTSKIQEIKQAAFAATAYLQKAIEGKAVLIKSYKPDKYGRYLADVFLPNSLITINEELVHNGHAKIYGGGARE